jgi:predicted ATPase
MSEASAGSLKRVLCFRGRLGALETHQMIRQLEFRAFKVLGDLDLDLERFTLLVGPNGSGKTSVLHGLHFLSLLAAPSSSDAQHPGRNRIDAVFTGANALSRIRSSWARGSVELLLKSENVTFGMKATPDSSDRDLFIFGAPMTVQQVDVVAPFGNAGRPQLDPAMLAAPGARDEARYHGGWLAPALADLLGRREAAIENIERDLRELVPSVRRLRVVAAEVVRPRTEIVTIGGESHAIQRSERVPGYAAEVEMEGVGWLRADLLSEGTLLGLGLFTLLHLPTRPGLILLDDLDRGFHPSAQVGLVKCIKQLQESAPDLQVIATSHSPYLLDALAPEEVRVMGLKGGRSVCRRLIDHPHWSEWKGSLRPGEFWGSVGEDWVVE